MELTQRDRPSLALKKKKLKKIRRVWSVSQPASQRRVKLGVCWSLSSLSTEFSGKHLTAARFPTPCLLLLTLRRSRGGITGTKISVSNIGLRAFKQVRGTVCVCVCVYELGFRF